MILDTNAISSWWKREPQLLEQLSVIDRVCFPIPAIAEFRFGILKSTRRAAMEDWYRKSIRVAEILSIDVETAEYYAQTRLILEAKGAKIPMNDLWIAAIALQHNLSILSRDTHFDVVEGIKRISW